MKIAFIASVALGLSLFGMITESRAQDLTTVRNLHFGIFALSNNNAPYSVTIDPNNNVTADPEIIFDVQPERGEYLLTGQDPNRALDITITDGSLTLGGGGGRSLTVTNYTDNNPSTDGAGDATIYIGATLTTDGNTTLYNSGGYEDTTVEMTVDYQ